MAVAGAGVVDPAGAAAKAIAAPGVVVVTTAEAMAQAAKEPQVQA